MRRKPHSFKKTKPFFLKRNFWLAFFFVSLFVFLFYFVFFSEKMQVRNVEVSGNNEVSKEEILSLSEEGIRKELGPLLSRSFVLVDRNGLEEKILKAFPKIAQCRVLLAAPDLKITIIEK